MNYAWKLVDGLGAWMGRNYRLIWGVLIAAATAVACGLTDDVYARPWNLFFGWLR